MTDDQRITEGWAFPTTSARKSHYFVAGRSLCGKYGWFAALGALLGNLEEDNGLASVDDCVPCRRLLEKNRAGRKS